MKNTTLYIILLVIASQLGMAQTENVSLEDALSINGNLTLRGRWQTGNLNQISLMPGGYFSLTKPSFFAELNTTYHFLRVNGFNVKNDLWNYALMQYQPGRRLFPSIHVIVGYAKSYRIDHSIIAGPGVGLNIHNKSGYNFFQVHIYGAYLDFQYEEQTNHSSLAMGTLLKSKIPLNKHVSFQWELSTYHSMQDRNYWGGGNLIILNFKVLKNLSLNITHQTYYNNQTTIDIKKTNTEMLFGIQYNFTN